MQMMGSINAKTAIINTAQKSKFRNMFNARMCKGKFKPFTVISNGFNYSLIIYATYLTITSYQVSA
jgi:hypothetical protein